MGECLAYSSLLVDSKVKKNCSMACVLAATWRRSTFIQVTQVNSRNGFSVRDSNINIVLVIIFYQGTPGGSKITKISYNICLVVHPTLASSHNKTIVQQNRIKTIIIIFNPR